MDSPTLHRISLGRTDLVFDFVMEGHSASSTDASGVSLIAWCAYHGDVSAIRFLLSQGESLGSLGLNFDLNGAVFHGHLQLCEFLLEKGADVHHCLPETGESPLHSALCKRDGDRYDPIVRLLLSHGANPNATTKPGMMTGAFMRDCRTKGETPLHRAAAYGSERAIGLLLDAGAQLDAKDMHGDSPLSWASMHLRCRSIIRRLCYGSFRA